MAKVLGRKVELSDGRLVYLGKSEEAPGVNCIGFRNAEGEDLLFTLSDEALNALIDLAGNRVDGPLEDFPHKNVWQHIRKWDDIKDSPNG